MSQKTVELLNRAFESDPGCIHAMLCNFVPCNEKLANDDIICINTNPVVQGSYKLTMLGLVNAILEVNNLPKIAMKWEIKAEKEHVIFKGFINAEDAV